MAFAIVILFLLVVTGLAGDLLAAAFPSRFQPPERGAVRRGSPGDYRGGDF